MGPGGTPFGDSSSVVSITCTPRLHSHWSNIELQARIGRRRETSNFAPWKDTGALASYKDLLEDPAVRPDAVFIGIPASCHGEEIKKNFEGLGWGTHRPSPNDLDNKPQKTLRRLESHLWCKPGLLTVSSAYHKHVLKEIRTTLLNCHANFHCRSPTRPLNMRVRPFFLFRQK